MATYSLDKAERLKSKKTMDALFLNQGLSAFNYPIKAVYQLIDASDHYESTPSIAITVPKKKFKSAVDRNQLKRRIREAYRLNRLDMKQWCLNQQTYIPIVFIYIATQKEPYEKIEKAIIKIIKSITK